MKINSVTQQPFHDAVVGHVEAADADKGVTIETFDGKTHHAFEPISVGRDYITFKISKQTGYKSMTIPFSAVVSLM